VNRRTVPPVYWASLQKAQWSSSSDQQAGPPLSKRDLLIVVFGPSLWLGMAAPLGNFPAGLRGAGCASRVLASGPPCFNCSA
jgi:hypothetical protein